MKTKNNVSKKAARFFAVFAVACLVGTGVLAADAKKAAPVKTKKGQAKSETSVLLPTAAETIVEAPIEIENWMTDASNWDVNNILVEEAEQELMVEDWMIENNWELKSLVAEDTEAPLTTEEWMTTGQAWFTGEFDSEVETAMLVESWMINENIWK